MKSIERRLIVGTGRALTKILENLVCGVIVGCIVSMTPCVLGVLIMLIPALSRFYETSIKVICILATSSSIMLFCYLDFVRKPDDSAVKDKDSKAYKWVGFVGEIFGSFFPIIILL
jgi:uncharacterized protein YqgC (DUF456 family)